MDPPKMKGKASFKYQIFQNDSEAEQPGEKSSKFMLEEEAASYNDSTEEGHCTGSAEYKERTCIQEIQIPMECAFLCRASELLTIAKQKQTNNMNMRAVRIHAYCGQGIHLLPTL